MSWALGFVDCGDRASVDRVLGAADLRPIHQIASWRVRVAAGGIPETCHFERTGAGGSQILLGAGLHSHYVRIRVSEEETSFANDELGLRTIYFRPWRGGLVFSTRLDLLVAATGSAAINMDALGAQWLTFNRWTSDPLLSEAVALGQGGRARYRDGRLEISARPWLPNESSASREGLADMLRRHAEYPDASLGLSGGVDSRVLLALQIGAGANPYTHVFGDGRDPDVRISTRIARRYRLHQTCLIPKLPALDRSIRLLERHAAEACLIVPASQAIKVQPYDTLHSLGRLVVDGGFGEIARRQFMNRLLMHSPHHLRNLDAAKIQPFVAVDRGSIFTAELTSRMRTGAIAQIEASLAELADERERPVEDLADLWSIRTRLPWYFGVEQARMDGMVRSIMPFAQSEVLDAVMSLPLRQRRRGRLMKRLIRSNAPSLGRMPLAKGGGTIPFSTPRELAFAWSHIRLRLRRRAENGLSTSFLAHLRPYVRDMIASRPFLDCPLYDHDGVCALVERYYGGETDLAPRLDWWLAFEAWRKSVA